VSQHDIQYDRICTQILAAPATPLRRLIAVAGPPGSGKSTFAGHLAEALEQRGTETAVIPMDGFHLDNRLLDIDGIRAAKGAPQTFDAYGFLRLVQAMQEPADLIYPVFDRAHDIAVAGAGRLSATCRTVLIEGNYLLFDAPVWRQLGAYWSLSIALTPPRDVLRSRLVQRWLDHGLSRPDAVARADGNDMKNTDLVLAKMLPADLNLKEA
jgi:pantothenate kinase